MSGPPTKQTHHHNTSHNQTTHAGTRQSGGLGKEHSALAGRKHTRNNGRELPSAFHINGVKRGGRHARERLRAPAQIHGRLSWARAGPRPVKTQLRLCFFMRQVVTKRYTGQPCGGGRATTARGNTRKTETGHSTNRAVSRGRTRGAAGGVARLRGGRVRFRLDLQTTRARPRSATTQQPARTAQPKASTETIE